MCGIVGFVTNNDELESKNLIQMLNKISHRGPDNSSTSIKDNVYFGHARLSIIDLDRLSNQPMIYKDFSIVFNGEIYNYLELRKELIELGHTFQTQGDTEVILHAYEQWGIDCQNRFRGMWAFVIYDAKNKILFGSRDRFGIKPIYYVKERNYFAFASEIKPLLPLKQTIQPNLKIVASYLVTNLINFDKQTFFKDVFQLEGGTYFKYHILGNNLLINRYYSLDKAVKSKGKCTYHDFEKALNESFKFHIRSDVQIGTCLSGGLDSSTVTGKVSELIGDQQLKSITAKSSSPRTDESHFAKIAANAVQVDWNIVEPTYEYFRDHIEDCLYYQEEPVGGPSIFMQYSVMQKAKELGIKVMMDGQGGDETLLGYERYYSWMLSDLLSRGNLGEFIREYIMITKHSKLNGFDLFKQYIYFNSFKTRVKHLTNRHATLKQEFIDLAISNLRDLGYADLKIEDLQILELTKTNLPNLLKNEDRNSMLASIEARVPFVDHEVIETALNLSMEEKINNGYTKYCLRKYADNLLPKEITWRRDKKGFEAPTDIWMEKHKEIIKKYIFNSNLLKSIYTSLPDINKLSDKELWKLYNLALWEKQFLS